MRVQGLRRELQRHPPVSLDHRAPRGSEELATGSTDRHASPQDRHGLPAGVASPSGQDHHRDGGHGLLAAHTRHSTSTRRSWPGGRNAWGHASGSWRWTAVHMSAPLARVNESPSRMSLSTGLGRRAVRTSSPRPRRSPGHSRSPSSKTPGSAAARRAGTVGRCRETVHGWTETGSCGRSGQAAKAMPSLA